MSRKVSVPSVPSLAAALLLTAAVAVATSGRAYGQCRLYKKSSAVSGTDAICATVSCNKTTDILIACGLGPQTSKDCDDGCMFLKEVVAVRTGDVTCEACGYACATGPPPDYACLQETVEVEATCIATQ